MIFSALPGRKSLINKAYKLLIVAVCILDLYHIGSWTFAFYAFDGSAERVALFNELTGGTMTNGVQIIMILLNVFALAGLRKFSQNRFLRGAFSVLFIIYILLGVWWLL